MDEWLMHCFESFLFFHFEEATNIIEQNQASIIFVMMDQT